MELEFFGELQGGGAGRRGMSGIRTKRARGGGGCFASCWVVGRPWSCLASYRIAGARGGVESDRGGGGLGNGKGDGAARRAA